jgi:hypothetical protein
VLVAEVRYRVNSRVVHVCFVARHPFSHSVSVRFVGVNDLISLSGVFQT